MVITVRVVRAMSSEIPKWQSLRHSVSENTKGRNFSFITMDRELPELLTGRRGHACGGYTFEDSNVRFVLLTWGSVAFGLLREPFCIMSINN